MLKRSFSGGVAATAVLAPFIAPAVAQAAPAPAPDRVAPMGVVDPSTLESCTAHFGLTKNNGTVVSFDETVVGSATPVPHVNADIVPVLTYDDGGGIEQCVPVAAWTDEASFDSFMGVITSMYPYPGTGFYLIPGHGLNPDAVPTESYHFDLVMGAAFTPVWSLDWTPGLTPYPWASSGAMDTAALAKVRAMLPESVRAAWDSAAFSPSSQCPNVDDAALLTALVDLAGGLDVTGPAPFCALADMAFHIALFRFQIEGNVVPYVVNSNSAAAVPVTGSASAPILALASTLAGLGAGLVLVGRRRRLA